MGLKRSRAHLERMSRSSPDGDDKAEETISWVYFFFLFGFDVAMMVINTVVWAIAGVVLWGFSKVHDKLLMKLVGANYLYNVSWEDPRVDRETLNLSERDHVLTIASAGEPSWCGLKSSSSLCCHVITSLDSRLMPAALN